MTTATIDFDQFTLTSDQQAGADAFYAFLTDPNETAFVLRGYSGCGKSTLVRMLLDRLPNFMKTVRLINPDAASLEVLLTATTNKAAEVLGQVTGMGAVTIHSALGLRVVNDYQANTTTLKVANPNAPLVEGKLLFIDEASFIDSPLLGHVFTRTKNCKIVFVGDPAQLTQVNCKGAPVFEAKFPGAALTQVVRQAEGNPIVDLSTKFRHAVNTGEFFSFRPDGHHIVHLDREAFNEKIEAEFTRADWRYIDSKILAWTNKCVIGYNQYVRNLAKGDPRFESGDYAVCNSFVQLGKTSIKTDQLVQITEIEADCECLGVQGNYMTLDYRHRVFVPKSLEAKLLAIKKARALEEFSQVATMEGCWADLRAIFAQTINKSQGSTYGSVFIDLDDVARCHNGNQLARMLYVAVSRAKQHVFLTGDLA
jgi:energy-coupling factor transporter ATP-binding protein EcfA2